MQPDVSLRRALDHVYETFKVYSPPRVLEASPLRDPVEILNALTAAPLQMLSVENVESYVISALTTVGNVQDYKHFLPRILELAVESALVEPEIIASKLRYAGWHNWPLQEQRTVADVFYTAGNQALNAHPDEYLADGWLCGIAILRLDIREILQAWQSAQSAGASLQRAHLLTASLFESDLDERGYWSEVDETTIHTIQKWLLSQEARADLLASRSLVSANDIWLLEKAVEMQERLIASRLQ